MSVSDSHHRSVSIVSPTLSTAQGASTQDSGPQVLEPVAAKTSQDALGEPCTALLTSRGIFLRGPHTGPVASPQIHRPKSLTRASSIPSHPNNYCPTPTPSQIFHTQTQDGTQLHIHPRTLPDCAQVRTRGGRPLTYAVEPRLPRALCDVIGRGTNELLTEFVLVVKPGRRSRLMPFSSLEVSRVDGWDGTKETEGVSRKVTFLLGADCRLLQRPQCWRCWWVDGGAQTTECWAHIRWQLISGGKIEAPTSHRRHLPHSGKSSASMMPPSPSKLHATSSAAHEADGRRNSITQHRYLDVKAQNQERHHAPYQHRPPAARPAMPGAALLQHPQ